LHWNCHSGPYYIGSYHSGPYYIGNCHSGPYYIGSYHSGPYYIGSYPSGPYYIGSYHSGPYYIGSYHSGAYPDPFSVGHDGTSARTLPRWSLQLRLRLFQFQLLRVSPRGDLRRPRGPLLFG